MASHLVPSGPSVAGKGDAQEGPPGHLEEESKRNPRGRRREEGREIGRRGGGVHSEGSRRSPVAARREGGRESPVVGAPARSGSSPGTQKPPPASHAPNGALAQPKRRRLQPTPRLHLPSSPPRPQRLQPAGNPVFPLPVQTLRDPAVRVSQGRSRGHPGAGPICPCAPTPARCALLALWLQNIWLVGANAPARFSPMACEPALPACPLAPAAAPSSHLLDAFGPASPTLRAEVTTVPRGMEAGFISAPFFLPRKRLADAG